MTYGRVYTDTNSVRVRNLSLSSSNLGSRLILVNFRIGATQNYRIRRLPLYYTSVPFGTF